MKISEPVEVKVLPRLNERGPDDLFICCASFEERCLSSAAGLGTDFLTKFAAVFTVEDPLYKKQLEQNMFRLQSELRKHTTEGIFVVSCQRESPVEGIRQLDDILRQSKLQTAGGPFITVDISGFTKIYLLELLHYLAVEKGLGMPRLLIPPSDTCRRASPGESSKSRRYPTTTAALRWTGIPCWCCCWASSLTGPSPSGSR